MLRLERACAVGGGRGTSGVVVAGCDVTAGPDGTGGDKLVGRPSADGSEGAAPPASAGDSFLVSVGTSASLRSGASLRRSPHGTPKAGSPSPWPPNISIRNDACMTPESSNATASRPSSRLVSRRRRGPRLPGGRVDRTCRGTDRCRCAAHEAPALNVGVRPSVRVMPEWRRGPALRVARATVYGALVYLCGDVAE